MGLHGCYRHERIRNVIAATSEYGKTKFAKNGLRNSVVVWQSSTLKSTGRRVVDMTIHSTIPGATVEESFFSEKADLSKACLALATNLCDVKLSLSLYPSNVDQELGLTIIWQALTCLAHANYIDLRMAVSLIFSRSLEPCGECKQSGDFIDCESQK